MDALIFLAGLVLLVLGGDLLVRGAVALAQRLGVSPLVIGLTVVGFGTSMPELVTSLKAAFADAPGIAVGNVVGSNIANVLLILGIAAVITPIAVSPGAYRRDSTSIGVSALATVALALFGEIGRIVGAGLLLMLAVYLWSSFRQTRVASSDAVEDVVPIVGSPWLSGAFLIGGIAVTILGAQLLVRAAIAIATDFGVSQTLIGLTIVAVGTSLPELVTSVVAALRRQTDIAFGNVVGSNIFNVFGILGITAALKPLPVPDSIARFDVWIHLAVTAVLLLVARTDWRITRREGALLLLCYAAYLAILAVRG